MILKQQELYSFLNCLFFSKSLSKLVIDLFTFSWNFSSNQSYMEENVAKYSVQEQVTGDTV